MADKTTSTFAFHCLVMARNILRRITTEYVICLVRTNVPLVTCIHIVVSFCRTQTNLLTRCTFSFQNDLRRRGTNANSETCLWPMSCYHNLVLPRSFWYATYKHPAEIFKTHHTYISLLHCCIDSEHRLNDRLQLIARSQLPVARSNQQLAANS